MRILKSSSGVIGCTLSSCSFCFSSTTLSLSSSDPVRYLSKKSWPFSTNTRRRFSPIFEIGSSRLAMYAVNCNSHSSRCRYSRLVYVLSLGRYLQESWYWFAGVVLVRSLQRKREFLPRRFLHTFAPLRISRLNPEHAGDCLPHKIRGFASETGSEEVFSHAMQ